MGKNHILISNFMTTTIHPCGGGVDMLPGHTFQASGQDLLALGVEELVLLRQERRHLARRNLHARQREEGLDFGHAQTTFIGEVS
jgi:hypothetical protein